MGGNRYRFGSAGCLTLQNGFDGGHDFFLGAGQGSLYTLRFSAALSAELPVQSLAAVSYTHLFVGGNEFAKTTLFKILSGEMEPDEGTYKWGITTSQSYFPKDNSKEFDNDDTIVDWLTQYSEIKDATYVRGFLGRMLFAGEDGVKKVKVLSGGEKVRCMLSKLMISGANVLILDEPTDHLDMESITALNNGLIKFPGAVSYTHLDVYKRQQVASSGSQYSPNK